jgi:WD40 repeat protein
MRSIDLKKRLAIRSLCFDPSGAFLAVAADRRAEVYKTDTLERVLCVMPYKSHVSSVSFNHDGTLFAVASEKKIRVFTLDGKLVTCIYDKEKKPGSPDNPYPNISFIGKNSLIALRTVNDVHLFNLKGNCIFSLSQHTDIPIDFKTITCFNKKKPSMLVATDSGLRMIKFSDFVAM